MTFRDENAARRVTEAARGLMTCQRPANGNPGAGSLQPRRKLRPQSKRASLLRAFLNLGERGMNCFEAANQHHDYVLRSSVSDFRRCFGIQFLRKFETVPGHNGSKIECCRYWLSPDGARIARELLEGE